MKSSPIAATRSAGAAYSTLLDLVLAALAAQIPEDVREKDTQWQWLGDRIPAADARFRLRTAFHHCMESPSEEDRALLDLSRALRLSAMEMLSVSLAVASEFDPLLGRLLVMLQSPLASSRPSLALLSRTFDSLAGDANAMSLLANGNAARSGLLCLSQEDAPLVEKVVTVPMPICLTLRGDSAALPAGALGVEPPYAIPLPLRIREEARRHARALTHEQKLLLIRAGNAVEGCCAAALVAEFLDKATLFLAGTDKLSGLTPWLLLHGMLPVYSLELSPGEKRAFHPPSLYTGPVIIVIGRDGELEGECGVPLIWRLPIPDSSERAQLWREFGVEPALADSVGTRYRASAGRISVLARLARDRALVSSRDRIEEEDLTHSARSGEATGLNTLAELVSEEVSDAALVLNDPIRSELKTLRARCEVREGLDSGLGKSLHGRYRPAVRALFVGPSGTGKTMAAIWLATSLGIPLYRVDLAAVTSKYIGETEKNLSVLMTRAEDSEVLLLFDEADSLFAKRTEVRDANDRFANSQTNYLLQRMESFDGIVVLTSNTVARFDSAFIRRFDMMIEFPMPGPSERRDLWLAHLGDRHQLSERELNCLAISADVAGGQIRNAVLTAAVAAREGARQMGFPDVIQGLRSEYRKMSRQLPDELRAYAAATQSA